MDYNKMSNERSWRVMGMVGKKIQLNERTKAGRLLLYLGDNKIKRWAELGELELNNQIAIERYKKVAGDYSYYYKRKYTDQEIYNARKNYMDLNNGRTISILRLFKLIKRVGRGQYQITKYGQFICNEMKRTGQYQLITGLNKRKDN